TTAPVTQVKPATAPVAAVVDTAMAVTAPVLETVSSEPVSPSTEQPVQTVVAVAKSATDAVGTATAILDPAAAPVTEVVQSAVPSVTNAVQPVLAPVSEVAQPVLGSTSESIAPVVAPVASVVAPATQATSPATQA